MRSGILILAACLLAGCVTPPTSVEEPPETTWPAPDNRTATPRPVPTPGDSRASSGSSTRLGSISPTARRPATVAYSANSTGVTAADALLREGRMLHQRGDFGAAANSFERGIRMAPRSAALYLALARTRLAMGDNSRAIQMANRAISLLPAGGVGDSARREAWLLIAEARDASGDHGGATVARQKARGG